MTERALSEFEQLLLLSVLRVGDDAYGTSIQQEIRRKTGRSVSVASIYVALTRLERGGLVSSWIADPTPVRGGRSKRCYRMQPEGVEALRRARRFTEKMWSGIDLDIESETAS